MSKVLEEGAAVSCEVGVASMRESERLKSVDRAGIFVDPTIVLLQ